MTDLYEIIQTEIHNDTVNSVNAREIHEKLKVKTRFNDWITRTIERYAFREDIDYSKMSSENSRKVEYIVTIDMAKELCMVDDSSEGKKHRKYFISVEKSNTQLTLPNNAIKQIKLALAGVVELDERVDAIHERTNQVEQYILEDIQNRPVGHTQQTALLNARHKKVFQILESYGKDKEDKELKRKIYAKVGSQFKKKFDLPRYDSLPNVKFNDGLAFINNLSLKDMA